MMSMWTVGVTFEDFYFPVYNKFDDCIKPVHYKIHTRSRGAV